MIHILRFVVSLIISTSLVHAVVVWGPDGKTGYNTSTGAGNGWDYVGKIGGGSGVYLGEYNGGYWVLTADHVGAGTFNLSGTNYSAISGSKILIKNPDNTATDLIVFRIDSQPPSLSNLTLRSTSITNGTSVKMMGYGRDRTSNTSKAWWVKTDPDPSLWQWDTIYQPGWTQVTGYETSNTRVKRWGNNAVYNSSEYITYNVGGTPRYVQTFVTQFNSINGDAQGITGDSGGGVFTLNGKLSGIMLTVGTYPKQPTETAIEGTTTYIADIFHYRDVILAAIPEPGTYALLALGGLLCFVGTKLQRRFR